jgi:hypothetical protein
MHITKSNNVIEINGSLSIVVFDTEKNIVKQELFIPNLVVTAGKTFIASRVVGTSQAVMSHIGVGTSATTETIGDTILGAELTVAGGYTGYARQAVTASFSGNVVTYTATLAANNPSAPSGGAVLREAGIFNASSGGTMLCRTTFPAVTKLPADALTISWTITVA